MNYLRSFLLVLCAFVSFQALAETATPALTGDIARGKALSQTCATCHGPEGLSTMPVTPSLAGQHASYIVHSLVEFKKGPQGMRNNPIMMGMAMPLSDQDMADLGAYYESLPAPKGKAESHLVARGEAIYRGGLPEQKVPACIGCHGPKGQGIASAKYPDIAGQNSDYTIAQLTAFHKGERKGPNGMMGGVTKNMTPEDMAAVASYVQGLH